MTNNERDEQVYEQVARALIDQQVEAAIGLLEGAANQAALFSSILESRLDQMVASLEALRGVSTGTEDK